MSSGSDRVQGFRSVRMPVEDRLSSSRHPSSRRLSSRHSSAPSPLEASPPGAAAGTPNPWSWRAADSGRAA